ncbi:hypothetical protein MUO14_13855 [Halobacillus shinanisalinarum]|uniref:N-acetyltransferase domain-containing protein n=1 Tax=Halobacillus shinanisalinarum TaxID=2932258 RepID=A0ABY4GUR2_9BACI|nr:hypothetical protein [Halobacillus shinanisalinarum]UOQ91638.1 hypothetical protein MUO14_13855 [Halobacillus shinanisalinarum]
MNDMIKKEERFIVTEGGELIGGIFRRSFWREGIGEKLVKEVHSSPVVKDKRLFLAAFYEECNGSK